MFRWKNFKPEMVHGDGEALLVDELTTYRDLLPELLQHEGEYVVIKAERHRILPDRESALRYAIETYGREPVLVKRIARTERFDSLGGALP